MNLPDTRTRLFPAFFLGTFLALTAAAQQPPPAQASAEPKVGDYVASRIPGLTPTPTTRGWYRGDQVRGGTRHGWRESWR